MWILIQWFDVASAAVVTDELGNNKQFTTQVEAKEWAEENLSGFYKCIPLQGGE